MYSNYLYLLDAICLSLIISVYFKKNKSYLLLHTIVLWVLCMVTTIQNNVLGYTCFILFLNSIFSFFIRKEITASLSIQILLAIALREFCKLVIFTGIPIFWDVPVNILLSFAVSWFSFTYLAYIIFFAFACLIYGINFHFHNKKLWLYLCLVLIFSTLIQDSLNMSIISMEVKDLRLVRLCVYVIGLFIMLITYIVFTNKEHEMDIKLRNIETQNLMVKNNLKLIESVSSRLSELEHNINYVLIKLKYLIIKKDEKEAINLIESNLWSLSKVSYYFNTNNPYFDYMFAGAIKKLSQKKIKPIIICDIQKGILDKNIYLTSIFIDFIDQIYNVLNKSNKVQISIEGLEDYLTLSIFIMNVSIEQLNLINFNFDSVKENNVRYSLNKITDSSYEFKFVLSDLNK